MPLDVKIEKRLGAFTLNMRIQSDSGRIGILGASGCGKSMTLKCIAGIETPDRGQICLDGRCLFDSETKINEKPQARKIGYLFQNYALFPTMTVAQNVAAGIKGSRREREKKAGEMIARFRLEGLEGRLPGELSGGQQQRVALARIMAYEPDLILLDEPFSALDVYLKEQLWQEMRGMLDGYRGTVVLVSHSRDEIYQFSDYLVVMDQGRAVRWGQTKEIFANPINRVSASLTGCKNISAAEKRGERTVYAREWNLLLRTGRPVPDRIGYVGIRAHDIEPVWSMDGGAPGRADRSEGEAVQRGEGQKAMRENCIPCRVGSVSEAPFETVYLVETEGGKQRIWWKVPKNRMDSAGLKGLPPCLYLPPDRLLLLEEDEKERRRQNGETVPF